MRCLLFICLIMLCATPTRAEELHLIVDTSERWQIREIPQPPKTDQELLALQAVVTGTTVTQDGLTAYYNGRKGTFDIVTVDEAPESASDLHAVISYQFRNGRICGDTNIKYVSMPNPEHERVARETAKNYLLGRGGQTPVIFNGSAYVVQYDGKCLISVAEKDDATVHFTYRYNSCR
jgi:hypothetical protein